MVKSCGVIPRNTWVVMFSQKWEKGGRGGRAGGGGRAFALAQRVDQYCTPEIKNEPSTTAFIIYDNNVFLNIL